MRSDYGFRSLARNDPAYNNDAIIDPYSNWRGPDLDQRQLSRLDRAAPLRLQHRGALAGDHTGR